jgi:hypothetical protein
MTNVTRARILGAAAAVRFVNVDTFDRFHQATADLDGPNRLNTFLLLPDRQQHRMYQTLRANPDARRGPRDLRPDRDARGRRGRSVNSHNT